jgi:GNAT superfamily N-acetyltransferase
MKTPTLQGSAPFRLPPRAEQQGEWQAHGHWGEGRWRLHWPADPAVASWSDERNLHHEHHALRVQRRAKSLLIEDDKGAVQGGAILWLYGQDIYLHLLWIAPAWRGHGLGDRCMHAIDAWATHHGATRLYVNTMSFQAPQFYPRYGFRPQGVFYDFTHGHDRHYFDKPLAPVDTKVGLRWPNLPTGLRWSIEASPSHAALRTIEDGLDAHWLQHIDSLHQEISLEWTDARGRMGAGAVGIIDGAYFTLAALWVEPDYRGHGLGRFMIALLCRAASQRGCRWATVMPMDWEAPDFFRKLGFVPNLRMDVYLLGRGRTWMRKALPAPSHSPSPAPAAALSSLHEG